VYEFQEYAAGLQCNAGYHIQYRIPDNIAGYQAKTACWVTVMLWVAHVRNLTIHAETIFIVVGKMH